MILFWAWEVLNLNLFNFGFWHVLANLGIFDLNQALHFWAFLMPPPSGSLKVL